MFNCKSATHCCLPVFYPPHHPPKKEKQASDVVCVNEATYMALLFSQVGNRGTVTREDMQPGRKQRGQSPCVTACVRPDARREFSTDEKGCASRQSASDKGSASAGAEPRRQ